MEIVFAGFGGQGVLTSGMIVAYIAMREGNEVLWSPAYGGQMRGGKAFSLVKFDKAPIDEPIITKLDVLVAMNQPSLDFVSDLKDDGLLIVNSGLVDPSVPIDTKARILRLDVSRLALEVNSPRAANIVSIGALTKATGAFGKEEALASLSQYFEDKKKGKFNESNARAFMAGYEAV